MMGNIKGKHLLQRLSLTLCARPTTPPSFFWATVGWFRYDINSAVQPSKPSIGFRDRATKLKTTPLITRKLLSQLQMGLDCSTSSNVCNTYWSYKLGILS